VCSVDVPKLLEESGAILRGHFQLTSGRHSDVYFEKFRLLERPDIASALCSKIAERFSGSDVGLVAGPTTGGVLVAFEVARQLGAPAIYVESEAGRRVLRRGATVGKGARVLVVDDVLTTGKSVREVVSLLRTLGGSAIGVGVLIDRSEETLDFGCPLFAVHRVEAKSYAAEELPEWLARVPVTKPGTSTDV